MSCPRSLSEKSRRGLATVPYNGLSRVVCTMHANQIAEFSYVTLIASWPILCTSWCCAVWQSSDVAERMGSRKFLLKQKEVAEAFASWRDALSVFRPAALALLPLMHFHTIDIAKKSLSELQVWLERQETCFTHKPWPIWPFCSYIASNCTDNKTYIPLSLLRLHDLLLSTTM